jgi:hypothetical protein
VAEKKAGLLFHPLLARATDQQKQMAVLRGQIEHLGRDSGSGDDLEI